MHFGVFSRSLIENVCASPPYKLYRERNNRKNKMLLNKLALVTGGASGIGLEVAKLFAKEGATVLVVDINDKVKDIPSQLEPLKDPSLKHCAYVCDASKTEKVKELFQKIKKDHPKQKGPNVVVNCAGVLVNKPFLEINEDSFDHVLNNNLKGTFNICQAACKELVANFDSSTPLDSAITHGSIINVASVLARFSLPGSSAYSISKAGMEALTRSIAKEMGPYKIRCNTISPSYAITPMTINDPQEVRDVMSSINPLKRCADPKEIAKHCLFLASDQSSYINGINMPSDGGVSIGLF